MSERIDCAGLQVAPEIHSLLENEILPGTGLEPTAFWTALADIVARFSPRNRELLGYYEPHQDAYPSLNVACVSECDTACRAMKDVRKTYALVLYA